MDQLRQVQALELTSIEIAHFCTTCKYTLRVMYKNTGQNAVPVELKDEFFFRRVAVFLLSRLNPQAPEPRATQKQSSAG